MRCCAGASESAQTARISRNSVSFRDFSSREIAMTATATELTHKHCKPCEGGIPALSPDEVFDYLKTLPDWKLTADGKRLRREWRMKDFVTGLDFFQRIGQIAEA